MPKLERIHRPLVGIFVGGQSRRMGGFPKGLLHAPDGAGTLVERSMGLVREVSPQARIVLVGAADAYASLGLASLPDVAPGLGPLGGLIALLEASAAVDSGSVIALACDMPFINRSLLRRLIQAAPDAAVVAPRREARWEPLVARYEPGRTLPFARAARESGDYSLQRMLALMGSAVVELVVRGDELDDLDDWDSPGDVQGRSARQS